MEALFFMEAAGAFHVQALWGAPRLVLRGFQYVGSVLPTTFRRNRTNNALRNPVPPFKRGSWAKTGARLVQMDRFTTVPLLVQRVNHHPSFKIAVFLASQEVITLAQFMLQRSINVILVHLLASAVYLVAILALTATKNMFWIQLSKEVYWNYLQLRIKVLSPFILLICAELTNRQSKLMILRSS